MKALTITTAGGVSVLEIPDGDNLDELQESVGGLIELIRLGSIGCDLWCNEEGRLLNLPVNNIATALWWRESIGNGVIIDDALVGDVIITGGPDANGDTLGLTDEQVAGLLAFIAERC